MVKPGKNISICLFLNVTDCKKDMKEYKKEDYLHCKFCEWRCLKFYHNKNGKLVVGWKKLRFHTEFSHMEEMEEIKRGWIPQTNNL